MAIRILSEFKSAIVSVGTGKHHLINRTNATAAHMMLGNSVAPKPWEALGVFIGNWLSSLVEPVSKSKSVQCTRTQR